jgi:hypothetical protein
VLFVVGFIIQSFYLFCNSIPHSPSIYIRYSTISNFRSLGPIAFTYIRHTSLPRDPESGTAFLKDRTKPGPPAYIRRPQHIAYVNNTPTPHSTNHLQQPPKHTSTSTTQETSIQAQNHRQCARKPSAATAVSTTCNLPLSDS